MVHQAAQQLRAVPGDAPPLPVLRVGRQENDTFLLCERLPRFHQARAVTSGTMEQHDERGRGGDGRLRRDEHVVGDPAVAAREERARNLARRHAVSRCDGGSDREGERRKAADRECSHRPPPAGDCRPGLPAEGSVRRWE